MDFDYTDQQKALRKEITDFARAHLNDGAQARDAAAEFPRHLFQKCGAELKIHGLPVDESFGGRGLDPLTTITVLEAFGHACEDSGLVFSICAHLLAGSAPLAKFGTDAQKAQYLTDMCSGKIICINGMTEPGAGSDISSIQTTAIADGADHYLINGTKTLVTNGPVGDIGIVFAVTNPDVGLTSRLTPFVIDLKTEGVTIGPRFDTMGHRTITLGEITFTNVRVPATAILGGNTGSGMAIFNHAMNWERIGLFAAHAGTMRRLTETAIKRARTRKQFDKVIGQFQGVSHRIANMRMRTDAARLLCYHAAARLDKARDVALDASIVKLFVSEAWVETARDNVQVHGGAGFLTDTQAERPLRDAIGSTLYSGSSEIQRNIIAAWLGLPT